MPDSPTPNVWGYNGEDTDSKTGLQYLRARYYNPSISRFEQEDAWRGLLTENNSLNRYDYCYNNPVIYHDDGGHIPLEGVYGRGNYGRTYSSSIATVTSYRESDNTDDSDEYDFAETSIPNINNSSNNNDKLPTCDYDSPITPNGMTFEEWLIYFGGESGNITGGSNNGLLGIGMAASSTIGSSSLWDNFISWLLDRLLDNEQSTYGNYIEIDNTSVLNSNTEIIDIQGSVSTIQGIAESATADVPISYTILGIVSDTAYLVLELDNLQDQLDINSNNLAANLLNTGLAQYSDEGSIVYIYPMQNNVVDSEFLETSEMFYETCIAGDGNTQGLGYIYSANQNDIIGLYWEELTPELQDEVINIMQTSAYADELEVEEVYFPAAFTAVETGVAIYFPLPTNLGD